MAEHVCPNPVCKQSETGDCAEGFEDLEECPFWAQVKGAAAGNKEEEEEEEDERVRIEADDEDEVSDRPLITAGADDNYISVSKGTGLDLVGANDVFAAHPAKLVALVGPNDAGKTTLSVSLYEALQHGSFAGWSFAGSKTLMGFEQRCHLSRLDSRAPEPDTPRTPWGDGLSFLHLGLWTENRGRVDLVLGERAGEFYKRASNEYEDCLDLIEVKRADCVCILADGEKLIDSAERHSMRNQLLQVVEALIDAETLRPSHQRVAVVLTKYDKVKGDAAAEAFFAKVVDDLKKIHDADFSKFIVAARPKDEAMEARYGVSTLLNWWLSELASTPFRPGNATLETRRKFHSFACREV